MSFFIRVSAYIYHCESLIWSIAILLPSTAPQGLVILSQHGDSGLTEDL